MNRQEIVELMRRLRAEVPALESPFSQTVSIPHVLVELADAWSGSLTREHRQQIDALCRKISTSGTLLATYNHDWTRRKDAAPLPAFCWPLLLAVLLAWSESAEALGPDGRGLSLKCLNAALSACDTFKSLALSGSATSSSSSFALLQSWIDQRLAHAVCGVAE